MWLGVVVHALFLKEDLEYLSSQGYVSEMRHRTRCGV
jgi:hypothetical protein